MSRVPRRTRLHLSLLGLVALGLALATASPAHAAEAGGGGGVLLVVAAVVGLILLGEPLFVIIGVLATLCFFLWGEGYDHYEAYQIFVVKMANLTTKNVLLAIPFFVISGAIMTAGGIAERLVSVAKAVVGSLPGGLAMATVGACIFFAAISGSSPVTVIAIGSMIFPALLKEGYGERFSLGLIASAGSLGILIPPSIPMLVYAIVASATATVDVGELFLAGVLPGVFLGGLMCTYAFAVGLSARRASGEMDTARLARTVGGALLLLGGGALAAWLLARYVPALLVVALLGGSGYFLYRFRRSFWALLLPILILGGIYSGLFTPTEAAAVSVVYALVVELFIHRELRPADVPGIFVESGVLMGALLVIMALAFGLNDFLVEAKVPDLAVAAIKEMELSPLGFLLVVNLLLIVVGFFMDSVSAILIIVPLLVPVARRLGIDPVHLGIVFIVNLEIGYLTPPIGLNLFVASTVFERPMGTVIRSVLPFIALMLVGLGVVTYVPSLSLGPVNLLLRGKPFYEPLPAGLGEPVPAGARPPAFPAVPRATDGGAGQTVESLEERMQRAAGTRGRGAPGGRPGRDGAGQKKVMSLEEMMQRAREQVQTAEQGKPVATEPSDGASAAPPAAPAKKVLSLEEMMRIAKERAAAGDAGAAPGNTGAGGAQAPVGRGGADAGPPPPEAGAP